MCAQLTSKNSLPSPGFDDAFTDSLAQSVQKLWPIITSPATVVAGAGVKGIFNISAAQVTTGLFIFRGEKYIDCFFN